MKISHLLILPLSLTLLSSCNKNNDDKIAHLQYGQMYSTSCEEIDYQTLSEKVDSKETFLLAVYAKGCSCWSTFKSVAGQYMKENHVIIYSISYDAFHSTSGETLDNFGLKLKSGYTSFAIFNKGKILVDVNSEKKVLKEVEEFTALMNTSVVLPKIFYISLDQVDELYASEEKSLLYFARGNCSDCLYFNRTILDTYEAAKNIYILDCETIGIREYDEEGHLTPESQVAWNQFKVDYGLASTNNPDYGYDTGYVPSLFLLQGNGNKEAPQATFLSGACYFNDTLAKSGDDYVITSSYYTETRASKLQYLEGVTTTVLEGRTVPSSEVTNYEDVYFAWNQEKAAQFHDPLVKAFLSYAIPQVSHTGFKL